MHRRRSHDSTGFFSVPLHRNLLLHKQRLQFSLEEEHDIKFCLCRAESNFEISRLQPFFFVVLFDIELSTDVGRRIERRRLEVFVFLLSDEFQSKNLLTAQRRHSRRVYHFGCHKKKEILLKPFNLQVQVSSCRPNPSAKATKKRERKRKTNSILCAIHLFALGLVHHTHCSCLNRFPSNLEFFRFFRDSSSSSTVADFLFCVKNVPLKKRFWRENSWRFI